MVSRSGNPNAATVPRLLVHRADQLPALHDALGSAERVAIDTEVPIDGPSAGQMRVMSIGLRQPGGAEQAYVVDARDLDPTRLAPLLDGVVADAWNADFDARVVDAAVWRSVDTTTALTWWDCQLADALIHQGRSGFSWFHGLAWATSHYLGIEAEGKGTVQLSYHATDDLSDEQVAYAAADALHTLWVGDRIRSELGKAGLHEVCEIELNARPFLDQMERSGLPFDWPGWKTELDRLDDERTEVRSRVAMLTGGGQGSLFDASIEPSWNPGSEPQLKAALNRWDPEPVLAWTARRFGQARPLGEFDSITANVLREIGGDLCDAVLAFRNLTKTLTTYGDSIHEHLHHDGRLRPQYLQVVGTNTGRLASRNPNAQNFTPKMKPYFQPEEGRVFVYADLSQAELRFLAQVAKDEPLRAAFARGDDVHVSTAASMFGFDAATLQTDDPERFKELRQIAKALNFGIAYGSGAAALGRSLSANGTPTTTEEAATLLAQYRRTYPGTAAWAQDRIDEIDSISRTTTSIDWPLTLRLARNFGPTDGVRREFRRTVGRWPSIEEIADNHPDRLTHERTALLDEISWVMNYSAPVALLADSTPFTFSSYTLSGRRQQFNLHLERLFLTAALDAIGSSSPALSRIRLDFEAEHGVRLDTASMGETELARQFDDRPLRRRYIEAIAQGLGDEAAYSLLTRAASGRVSAMVNAWRNAPIQGGVADIMLVAYADLHRRLGRFDTAVPVQTVHDSVAVECFAADAEEVAAEVRKALEQASLRFCPDVVPKADVDIRSTLADADVISVLG